MAFLLCTQWLSLDAHNGFSLMHTMAFIWCTQWLSLNAHDGFSLMHTMAFLLCTQWLSLDAHNGFSLMHTMAFIWCTQWLSLNAHNGFSLMHTMAFLLCTQWLPPEPFSFPCKDGGMCSPRGSCFFNAGSPHAVEETYDTRYQSGSFSLIYAGSGFHCLGSCFFFFFQGVLTACALWFSFSFRSLLIPTRTKTRFFYWSRTQKVLTNK